MSDQIQSDGGRTLNQQFFDFKLPSGGAFYGGALPDGVVQVRRLKTSEEAIMATESMSPFQKMSALFTSTVRLPDNFKYSIETEYGTMSYAGLDGLLSTDRLAILIFQREITFGAKYSINWNCKACRNGNVTVIDVKNDLLFRTADEIEAELGSMPAEPFEIVLPDSAAKLYVRHLRIHDEASINHAQTQSKNPAKIGANRGGAGGPFNLSNYVRNMRTMAVAQLPNWGRMMPVERDMKFWNELSWNDAQHLDYEIERRETGVETELNAQCTACSASQVVKMEYGTEFFSPNPELVLKTSGNRRTSSRTTPRAA